VRVLASWSWSFFEISGGDVEDGELHAAGNIDAYCIGDDGVARREDAADGQAVALVGIGHERAADGDGEAGGVFHLFERAGFEIWPRFW